MIIFAGLFISSCSPLAGAAQASYFGFSLRGIVRDHVVVKGFSSDLRLSKTSFCRIEIGPLRKGQVVYRSQEVNKLFSTIENQEKLRIAGVFGV
jgi:hypothetical protein